MNPILAALNSHRSIRKYNAEAKVCEAHLESILLAASRASTSGNMQAYSIIVTQDSDIKQKLLAPHFGQTMVVEAPILMTFCADFRRMRRWVRLRDARDNFDNPMSFFIASIDAVLAAQNAAIAAESLGYGICFLGTTLASCESIGNILGCPPGVVPVVGFTLGVPNEEPEPRDRLPLKAIVHRDVYRDATDETLLDFYCDKEESGLRRALQHKPNQEAVERGEVSNLAQIYTQVKYTRESHLEYSKGVLQYLSSQDFWNQ